ncbi:hypothetical protein [Streptomyces hokutonensis]|uniref:hypothetical protein n=1 Tax=Streptomyces hokutonensis TaxID=1306990 RepID=UPI001319F4FB|nr:hypothetical protein [Streptomyces hokutonensis]
MSDGDPDSRTPVWGNWVSTLATFVAPTTFIGALLLYFGFAYTDAFYEYFGVDAATLGFSTQDYALRSAGALYVPAGAALTVALAGVVVYYVIRSVGSQPAPPFRGLRWFAYGLSTWGGCLFLLGALGGFAVWPAGAMGTPLLLGGGLVLVVYGRALSFKLEGANYPAARERLALALVAAMVALSSFWATHAYAKQHGYDDARDLAHHLWLRPGMTIDTPDRLHFPDQQVHETAFPADTHQRFRFRYQGLRLLAESNGRMFIIPENWEPITGRILVLPTDSTVRVTFSPG